MNQVVEHLPDDIRVSYFGWPAALLGRYRVFHLHWPESLLGGGRGPRAARLLVRLLVLRWWLTRVQVVRTLHNLSPHESRSAADGRVLDRVERRTRAYIRINDTTEFPASADHRWTVLHGDYRDRFARHLDAAVVPRAGRILFFGLIRPYKGIEALLEAFDHLDQAWTLRIVGRPQDAQLKHRLQAAGADDPRISVDLRFVPDEELVTEIRGAELVVLPYSDLHNSGAALVALSLDRPIIAPRTESTESLAAEAGPGWTALFESPLTADDLATAVAAIRAAEPDRSEAPALSPERAWAQVGRRHAEIYRELDTLRSRRRSPGRTRSGRP